MCSRGNSRRYNSQCASRLCYRDVRPPKRPAAPKCHVYAQTESARFVRRKVQIIDKFIGQIGEVVEAAHRIVEFEWVDGLNFDSPDSPFLHLAKFPGEFRQIGRASCRERV